VRTPEERFAGLLDFPFSPRYRELEGLRLAHLDEGDGPPVLLVHAEPTWSFLWRTVLPPLRDAGYRCVVPDHAGFGRSDKPTDIGWYSDDRHTANLRALVEERDLRGATVVVHDWGGPIASPRRSVVTRPRWSRAPATSSTEIPIATRQPAPAQARAVARLIPRAAPVMATTRPSRLRG